MKKVLWIVNQYSVTPDYPASTRHYEMAKYLSSDFEVHVFGSNFIHHNRKFRWSKWTLIKQEKIDNFSFHWLGAIPYYSNGILRIINMIFYSLLLFLVGLFKKKPDVIIGSSPTLFVAFVCWLLAVIKESRFILEVRDLWPESLRISTEKQGLIYKGLKRLGFLLYNKADKIITLTKGIQSYLVNKGFGEDKVIWIPNGIDPHSIDIERFNEENRSKIREQLGLNNDDFVFMYAGAHGPANALEQIILAAEKLKDEHKAKFVFIGEGIEKPKLQQLVNEKGLTQKVFLLPGVPKSEIHHYLNAADAFIICLKDISLFEGAFPNKLFDYLLHNKPIITTVKGELKEFLEDNHLGFYGNLNEQNECYLPEVMKQVMLNYLYFTLGNNGRQLVLNLFNRQKQVERLKVIIQQSLEGVS